MAIPPVTTDLPAAVSRLDSWLESIRCVDGYGGPVSHWWQNCLQYTGAGLDWRYEGITIGYLSLWETTKDEIWLDKARRCGDDLVTGQLPNGSFKNSEFELNPYSGGTPHEAACDIALLRLVRARRSAGYVGWERYLKAVEANIHGLYVERLWSDELKLFLDSTISASFVPNKAATLVEALLAFFGQRGEDHLISSYVVPTLQAILDHQIVANGSPLDGGIYQNSLCKGGNRYKFVEKLFPFYVARCIPALVEAYGCFGDKRYIGAALSAGSFILRHRLDDGSYPQVVYGNGRVAGYPRWVAGTAEILRALEVLQPFGMDASLDTTGEWLMRGQDSCGGFRTAVGFGSQSSQKTPGPVPEFRDLLHVAGWSSMAFRYLSSKLTTDAKLAHESTQPFETQCVFRGMKLTFFEDDKELAVNQGGNPVYRWVKGSDWSETTLKEFYLK